jgi:hypothetical protein
MPSTMSQTDEFLMWVGNCITAWAGVEQHLFRICAKSLGTTDKRAAIIYYRTPTLDARLSLTDELVRTVLPKREQQSGGHDHPDVKKWNQLRKDIGSLLPTRNKIAHHPIFPRQIDTGGMGLLDGMTWYEIYVSEAERLRGRHEDTKPLMAPDLSAHRLAVHGITRRLEEFLSDTLPEHCG